MVWSETPPPSTRVYTPCHVLLAVQTDAHYNQNEHYLTANMSVTASTAFDALVDPGADCMLEVTHDAASGHVVSSGFRRRVPPWPRANSSRVRVDSLMMWCHSSVSQ